MRRARIIWRGKCGLGPRNDPCGNGRAAELLAAALFTQLRTRRYTPWIYWLTVVLVSVVGTQITDLLNDGLGVSLYGSTSVFAVLAVVRNRAFLATVNLF